MRIGVGVAVGARSGSGFTPLALGASLYDMWDAEQGGTISLSGSAVTEWRSVKNGYQAVQGVGAARPLYSATGLNNRPTIAFDGADDFLNYESSAFLPSGSTPGEIWFLGSQDALSADAEVRLAVNYGQQGASRAAGRRTSGNVLNGVIGNGSSGVNTAALPGFSGPCVSRLIVDATSGSVQLNGAVGADTAVATNTTNLRTRFAASVNSTPVTFWLGKLTLVAFTARLTDPQAAQMLAYLKARGGIA